MSMARTIVTKMLPRSVREPLRAWHRGAVFSHALKRVRQVPQLAGDSRLRLISDLSYGWDNVGWSAPHAFLEACWEWMGPAPQTVLECGSGLSTILLGALAERTGSTIWTLEDDASWGDRVRQCLRLNGITTVNLCVGPLERYDEYDWYAPPFKQMPKSFSLVICDGPASTTRGGRYGMAPVMRDRLPKGVVVLMDDANREGEQLIARRWATELPGRYEQRGSDHPYFVFTVEGRAPGCGHHERSTSAGTE